MAYLRSFKKRTRPLGGDAKEEAAQLKRFEEVRKREQEEEGEEERKERMLGGAS